MLSEVSAQRSTPMLVEYRDGAVDLCETPDLASLPLASSGIALLEQGAWPCIPQRNLEVAASALLLEHRLPCRENCNGAGFYAVPKRCLFSGEGEQGEIDGPAALTQLTLNSMVVSLQTVHLAPVSLGWTKAINIKSCGAMPVLVELHASITARP